GTAGLPSSKHFKCYHGNRRVMTITPAMRSNLNGLIGNLKSASPAMYRFFELLKERGSSQPPTEEEIKIASGKSPIPAGFLETVEKEFVDIRAAFAKQAEKGLDEWDQKHFENLLVKWMVTCDQPFEEVE
ncbi:hypothetical protein BDN72DRAFT_751186, partial [Pluteus cervinus]